MYGRGGGWGGEREKGEGSKVRGKTLEVGGKRGRGGKIKVRESKKIKSIF